MTLELRRLVPAFVAACALSAAHCETRRTPPSVSDFPRATPASATAPPPPASSSRVTSSASPPVASARESDECPKQHYDQPFRLLETTERPRQAEHCASADCVSIELLVERGAPCSNRCRSVVITPRVLGATPQNKAIQELLDAQISEAREDHCWLKFLDYTIHHDAHGILDISFRFTGSGAYPSTQTTHVTIDLTTGERLRADRAFSPPVLPALTSALRRQVASAWKAAVKAHPEAFRGRELPALGTEHLEKFIVHPDGIVFLFDFGLPHALESATPKSEFAWTKPEIRPFIAPDGPLRFLRDITSGAGQ